MHPDGPKHESMSEHPPRPSILRTVLSVAAGIGALLLGLGLAVRPGLSPIAQLVLGICGFAGFIALVGPALDRRYRLDRQWRHDPPDLRAFRERKAAREKAGQRGPGSSGMPLAIAILVLGLTLSGDAAAAAGAPSAGTDGDDPPSTAPAESAKAAGLAQFQEVLGFDPNPAMKLDQPEVSAGVADGVVTTPIS